MYLIYCRGTHLVQITTRPLLMLWRKNNSPSCWDKLWLLWHTGSGSRLNQYKTLKLYIFALLCRYFNSQNNPEQFPWWTLMHNEDGRSPGKSLIYAAFRVVWCDLHMNTNLLPSNLIFMPFSAWKQWAVVTKREVNSHASVLAKVGKKWLSFTNTDEVQVTKMISFKNYIW